MSDDLVSASRALIEHSHQIVKSGRELIETTHVLCKDAEDLIAYAKRLHSAALTKAEPIGPSR